MPSERETDAPRLRAPVVTEAVDVIYYAGRRRFLTERAAYESSARQLINARCRAEDGCDPGDETTPGITCHWHDSEHFPALLKRLTRWLRRQDRCAE